MSTVTVTNISPETSRQAINDFFSFCGKIKTLELDEAKESVTATITFEQATAMNTALLLNNTQLGPNHITVSGSGSGEDSPAGTGIGNTTGGGGGGAANPHSSDETGEISQEEKPRARVIAEYMAHGYVIGDAAVTRALELDAKHGVSARFFGTLQKLDARLHATDKARAADQSYGVSQRAGSWLTGLGSYFEKASNTPTGQKIVKFYTEGQRQVQDVHAEALRLAELKKEAAGGSAVKAAGLERVLGLDKPGVDAAAGEQQQQQQGQHSGLGSSGTPAPGIASSQPLTDFKKA